MPGVLIDRVDLESIKGKRPFASLPRQRKPQQQPSWARFSRRGLLDVILVVITQEPMITGASRDDK
jgi:hypothetical protein